MIQSTSSPGRVSNRFVSVVIPCFNEEANAAEAVESVCEVLRAQGEAFEILAINDGSRDRTLEVLRAEARRKTEVVVLNLMRNLGQTAAYQAGLDSARGTHVVLFSSDLEISASEIPRVLEQLDRGHDLVNTVRVGRWHGAHAWMSRFANWILNRISGLKLRDRGSGLKGMSRELAAHLHLYGEWHRFLPDLASIHTSRITEFEVVFQKRKAGVSSYRGRMKGISVFLDLATVAFTIHAQRKPFRLLPGRLFSFTGLIITTVGFATSLWLVVLKLFFGESLSDRPLFMVSLLLAIIGFVMVMVGLLGELLMQISVKLDRLLEAQNTGTNRYSGQKKVE